MHSHDRTLLAKLGFSDPDRKNPLHDKACRYLAQPDKATALVDLMFGQSDEKPKDLSFQFELPISKGLGQYKTTIGFVDLVVCSGRRGFYMFPDGLYVEVKIDRPAISECIRQIRLYDSYLDTVDVQRRWALASPWSIDEQERSMLMSHRIRHVKLGRGFDEFCEIQSPTVESPEV